MRGGVWNCECSIETVILDFVADTEEFTTEVIVRHFGFPATSVKRYLRQLTEFGYLEARGGNIQDAFVTTVKTQPLFPCRESDFHIFAGVVPVLGGELGAHDNEPVLVRRFQGENHLQRLVVAPGIALDRREIRP